MPRPAREAAKPGGMLPHGTELKAEWTLFASACELFLNPSSASLKAMVIDSAPGTRSACRLALIGSLILMIIVGLAIPAQEVLASSPPRITITEQTALPLQVEQMELLRDPTRGLDLAQVRSPEIAERFETAAPGMPNLGVTQDAVWARFAVRNASADAQALLLILAEPRTSQVAYWALDQDGKVIAQRRDGRFADPTERDRSHRWFLFDLPLASQQTATVYVRVRTDMGLRLDLRLTDRMHLASADRTAYAWLALYFGAMLFMLAYNLLLLLQLREGTYFWLCVFIAGSMLWMADREGLLTTLTWRLWPDAWSGNQAGVALGLTGLFMFPVGLLRLREHAPRLRWISVGLSAVVACTPFLWQWSPVASYALVQATALLGGLGMLVIGALALRWQRRAAAQYLLAWSPLLIVIALIVMTNYGLTPSFSAVWALTYAAILLMLLLLSVAQADRVNELRRHAEHAQAALARNEERLTELVDERTGELAVQRDRAEAASRAKTRFLANMSHELRTPLNAVLGGADLLRRSPRLSEAEQDQCGLIQRGGRHLLRLIEDLLDVARIEHDRLRPLVTELRLWPMLDDLAAMTRRQAEVKGLAFEAHLAADLPELILTDSRRLRQVLQNLLDNAVKYTDTGSVALYAELDPAAQVNSGDAQVLVFTVTDTGRGIADADQQRLFAPFEQYHPGQAGSGLGLAICHELAAVLGGELTLDSLPGRGSRFCFRLRVQRVKALADRNRNGDNPSPPSNLKWAGPPRRILIIDDSEFNRLVMSEQLRQLGLAVDTADSAQAALVIARRLPPDLVIADLRMPEVCGYATTWQLREALSRPDLPAIAASASPLPTTGDATELGFRAFLLKPIELGPLCAAIGDCLGQRWVRSDRASADAAPAPGAAPAPEQPPPEDALPPPRIELDAARGLAETGDWSALGDWCTELADAFPECVDFMGRVRTLLDEIDAGPEKDDAVAALLRLLAGRG